MPSSIPGYEYDIFISYRQNDNTIVFAFFILYFPSQNVNQKGICDLSGFAANTELEHA